MVSNRYYIFICDSSSVIGTGHVVRCVNLALELHSRGAKVSFFHRQLPNSAEWLILDKKFELVHYRSFSELPQKIITLGNRPSAIIIDHYEIDYNVEQRLRPLTDKLMAIDDIFNRRHDCDILLNQNLYSNLRTKYADLIPEKCELLDGPEFALLSKEYQSASLISIKDDIKKVLIFFGGSDPTEELLKLQKLFLHFPQITFHIVMGLSCPHKEKVQTLYSMFSNVTISVQVKSLLPFFEDSDVYIGSGGSVTWERLTTGLPGIVASVAENQHEMSLELGNRNIQVYLGSALPLTADSYIAELEKMNKQTREILWDRSKTLTIGKGTKKTADIILT